MRRDREVGADVGHLGDLLHQVEVAQQQRRLRQHRARVRRVAQRLPDAAHELVAPLDPLVRVGVRPHRDVLALPRRPRQLDPQHLGRVDLDDDLLLEVAAGVEVEVGVGRAGEAVVADHAVGDEVAGAGGDVVQAHRHAKRLDAHHARLCVRLQRDPLDRALAGDRWVGEVEEAQTFAKAAADPDACDAVWAWAVPRRESKPKWRRHEVVQSRMSSVPVRDPQRLCPHEPSASKMPARKPLRQSSLGDSGQRDQLLEARDPSLAPAQRSPAWPCAHRHRRRRSMPRSQTRPSSEISVGAPQRFDVGKRKTEPVRPPFRAARHARTRTSRCARRRASIPHR